MHWKTVRLTGQLGLIIKFLLCIAGCGEDIAMHSGTPNLCTAGDKSEFVYRKNISFAKQWEVCGREAWGNSTDTTKCLRRVYPNLSENCAACFGTHASCSKSKCFWTCGFGSDSSCQDCSNTYCTPALATCTGVAENDIPKKK